jgi:polyisoprenoid-binding protein YceI
MPIPPTVFKISPSPDSTLAVEVRKAGWAKGKHLFVFEQFSGALSYDQERPLDSVLDLTIDANSVVCRDQEAKPKQREDMTKFAREQALASSQHPEIKMRSIRFIAKPLRGFVAEGTLSFHGGDHAIRANIGFGALRGNRIQIDADSTLRLSDYKLPAPSSLFGLIRTEDEVVLHALIWGISDSSDA